MKLKEITNGESIDRKEESSKHLEIRKISGRGRSGVLEPRRTGESGGLEEEQRWLQVGGSHLSEAAC